MRLVVALGGNALLRRGQSPSAQHLLENIQSVAAQLARVALHHELVVTHGNGPQIGLLALQNSAYAAVAPYPLDMLGAQTEGMIGYLLEQELANQLAPNRPVVTLLTRVEVDLNDPAFGRPTKPIGPVYTQEEAQRLAQAMHWHVAPDGASFRRVVASPLPLRVLSADPLRWLLQHQAVVIAAGGGGIPVARTAGGRPLEGVDAVIDKDLTSALLALELGADCLVIATDVDAVYLDWGQPTQRALGKVRPQELLAHSFPAGSMGPKVQAATGFVSKTGKKALIGSLAQIEDMLAGRAGTEVSPGGGPAA
ncbi:carbamate kinase [Polaromonas sp. JS666]|uniref:carbamate kinase n=1 Tax=Polaromonas sp. (strain JS666 / ATCC BAA-500) TaxID=296591 RepID=UPI0008887DD1|nr:carbamate kinase [Polaromonas sp. JS666]SDM44804.1 carbamate kinase [Polaromonas sp. JS666]